MKQLLLLLTITMATLTANAQAKLYDAFNLKARTTLQLGNKTITDFTDDTVMANKYKSKIMSEWATKKAIENIQTQLDSKISTSHTVNNITNGTGLLKNNGSGTWSYDNNSYIIGSGAANQIPYFVSGSVIGSNSNFKYTSELLLSQTNSTQTYSIINASNTFNNLGIRQGQNGLASFFGYQLANSTSNASDYGNVISLNGFYDGTNWFTKNGYIVPSMLMLRGNGGLSIFTNSISQGGVAGNFTPTETMTILGNGNVGINQANPSTYKLDVTGTGRFTSNVTANSFIKSGGTSSQFLKADGSVDANVYTTLTSLSATAPLSYNNTTGVFSISQANGSTNGYLSSTDWNIFNIKQSALGFTPENIANKKTTLSDNSDTYYPTQKAVKTAVDAKQDTITGGASTITSSNLTANRVLLSDGSGKVAVSSVTNTELGYVGGVTSSIQTQLNSKLNAANSNVKRYIRVNATTNGSNYAMDGTKEVVLIDYTDPCDVTLPVVSGLPDGSVFEIQFYNWGTLGITIRVYLEGGNSEEIDAGHGISSTRPSILFRSNDQTGNNVTPLSLRIMWLASDNVWTVLQGGVFDY